jgi:hypothetical protein
MKPTKLNRGTKTGHAILTITVILVAGFVCPGMTEFSYGSNRPFINVQVADMQIARVNGSNGILMQVAITITDLWENPIAGATVKGEFSGRLKAVVYGVTDKDGTINFQTNQKGNFTFTVVDVSCAKFRYELIRSKAARINTMETAYNDHNIRIYR